MARTIGSVEVIVSADTGKLVAQLRRGGEVAGRAARDAIDDQLAEIGGRKLTQRLAQVRGKIEAALEDLDVDIGADVDATEVRAAIAEIEASVAAADADVEIGADVDTSEVASTLAEVEAATSAGGSAAGTGAANAFSKSFLSGFGRFGAVAGGVIANSIQPAAVALEGVLGGSVAVVSSAMSGLIGLVGSLPPVGAGVLTSVAALRVGLDDVSEALDGNEEALAGLTPAAREFVEAFDGLRPAFDDVRDVVQGRLFAGLGTELERLADDLLPAVEAGLGDAADSLNTFFRDLADVAADVDLTAVFDAVQPVVDSLLDAVVSVARTVEPFLLAAAPAAQQLADGLAAGAEALADMVGENTAAITDFLTEGIDSLGAWAGLAGSIGDALITLFGAGRDAGDDFVSSLAGVIDQFDAWMEGVAGQRALADFFADAKEIVGDFAPLVEGLIGFFDRIVSDDAIDRFGQITDIIGDLLPVLGTMFDFLGRMAEPVLDVIEPLVDVIALFAGAWEAVPDPLKDAIAAVSIGAGYFVLLEAVLGPVVELVGDFVAGLADIVGIGPDVGGTLRRMVDWVPGLDALVGDLGDGADAAGEFGKVVGPVADKMDEATAATKEAADAAAVHVDAMEADKAAMREASAAQRERNVLLQQERDKAYDAWLAELDLAAATRDGAAAAADAKGFTRDLADQMIDLGDAAHDAADAADALKTSFDLLISPGVSVQESFSDLQQGIDDFNEAIAGGREAIDLRAEALDKLEEAGKASTSPQRAAELREEAAAANDAAAALEAGAATLDAYNPKGRENAELLRQQAADTITWAAAQLQAGGAAGDVQAAVAMSRETLVQQADAFGLTRDEAEDYVDVLLGTPEMLNTIIQTPGMVEALLNADDLTVLYDEAGQPVVTEFEALGLDPALASSQDFKDLLDALGLIDVAPTVDASGAIVAQEDIDAVKTSTEALDAATGEPTITVPPTAEEQLAALQTAVTNLDATVVSPTITIPFIDTNITRVGELDAAIEGLHDKTVTITVNTRGGLPAGFDLPNLPGLPGGMAGELITFPTVRRVGERGYREAIVPLDLPLSRIDPTVRALAALLRGGDGGTVGTGTTIHRQINVQQTITPRSADPGAVAQQVVNRAASLANR